MRTIYPARKGDRVLTVDDLWAIPRVGSPQPSPVSAEIAVAVKTFSMDENSGRSRIWLVPTVAADGARATVRPPRPMTAAEYDSDQPAFSPDGKRLLFRRMVAGHRQPFVMPLDGGEAEQLAELPFGVTDARFLPDGSGVVFIAEVLAGHLTVEATRAEIARRAKDPPPAIVTEERLVRFWDRFLAGGKVSHLYVLAVGGAPRAQPRDLTPDLESWFNVSEPEGTYDVAPDGSEVAFSVMRSEGDPGAEVLRSVIYTAPIAGGPRRARTEARVRAYQPRYTIDGAGIIYGWSVDPTFYADRLRLGRLDRASDTHTDLLADWNLSVANWATAAGDEVYFHAEDDGRTCLFALAAGAREPRQLTTTGTAGPPRVGSDSRLYYAHETLQRPAEACAIEPGTGGAVARLTEFTSEALGGVGMGEVRELEFEGAEGVRVQAWVVLPVGHDEAAGPVPLVHVVHGGPHGISGDNFHPRWNPQLFAAPGYVVACVNFQGSTSRGQEFAACIRGAWGDRPYRDILLATDRLVETGLVDAQRMAVTGASYGGYLAAWIGTQTDRFRCIVNHAGVFDLLAQYSTDVTHGRESSFGGVPWLSLEEIDRYSPARATKGMTTPMLVSHGEQDYRVPVTQGLECYNILKAKGVPARLVYFPGESHWVLKPKASKLWYDEVHAWLARFLTTP